MSLIDTSDFRNGLTIRIDNEPYTLIYFQHVKPGKGGAFVRTRLKSVRTGNVFERTFRAGEKFEPAYLERQELEYLYRAGDEYFFMNTETYDQVSFTAGQLGESKKYLKEGMTVSVLSHAGETIGVELPDTVELTVVDTDPGLRGDTASGGSKPATLESGAVVQVPLFVGVGETIRVDTRTDTYLERVKKT